MAGLDANGFTIKTEPVIRAEMSTSLRSAFGQSIDVSDQSILGRITGIMAAMLAELWELGEAVYSALDPDEAKDSTLDAIAALTGTLRQDRLKSTVQLTLTGTASVVVPANSRAEVDVTGALFQTTIEATIEGHSAKVPLASYTVGDRITNNGNVYVCMLNGTASSSAALPNHTQYIIVNDGSTAWLFLGPGTGSVDVQSESVDYGPIIASAYTLISVATPVSGWNGVVNQDDAILGRLVETDEDLRVRRILEIFRPGSSPRDAIRADILAIDGVTTATVFVNSTDETDSDGIPPHAVEVLVQGGTDQDIFDTLLSSVAAGIQTHGNTSGTALDSQGVAVALNFSRPVEKPIYVSITLVKNPDSYPADGDDQIKDAVVSWGTAQQPGKNAVSSAITAQAFTVAGVLEVSPPLISLSPGPVSSATIPIAPRELATYSVSNITVITSDGTP